MAKVKMTVKQAYLYKTLVAGYFYDGDEYSGLNEAWKGFTFSRKFEAILVDADDECEVELIDAASIQNEINKLQNLLESLNALGALLGVNNE